MRSLAKGLLARLGAWTGMGLALIGLTACISSTEFDALKESVSQLQKLSVQQQGEIILLKAEDRRLWRGLRCTNQQVADFMTEMEKCSGGQCPQRNLDRVLAFMVDQKHVLIRLRAGQPAQAMAPLRIGQLQELLKSSEINPLSRILVMTMAVNLNRDDAVRQPELMADQLRQYIRRDLQLALTTGYVGPFPVNCEQKSQLLENYSRHVASDKPVLQEPKAREPQVAIWIFKVDCG